MPRNRIAFGVLLLSCPSMTLAMQDAVLIDYLRPIVSKIADDPNAGGWIWENNGNGGYMLRMSMDVTGDGRPELFVTTSLRAVKRMAEWTVFDVNEAGEMRPYREAIRAPADSVWPSDGREGPSLVYVAAPDQERERLSDKNTYPVYRYRFEFPEVSVTLTHISETEAMKLRPTAGTGLPKLEAILLADYLMNRQATWREIREWKLNSHGNFFCPEDQDRAAKNSGFTPNAALMRLGVGRPTPWGGGRRESRAGMASSVVSPTAGGSSVTNREPTAAKVSAVSGKSWGVVAAVVVAALGVLWIIMKARKGQGK